MDETSDKAHISRSPPTIRAKKVKLMRSLSSGDNVPNRCQPDSVADNFTPLLPACLNVEPTSTTTSEPNDPLNAINDQTNYGATFTTTAEVEANCESPSKSVPKVGITDATTDFSTTDERPGTSSGDTGAHSFKTFSASWFHFPSRSSAAQGSSSHRRAQSIGTDLKYDNSTDNINSGWKCFPEIRHMSLPDGMTTMEESKERMMQTAEAMKLRMIQAGRDVSNKYKEWKLLAYQHLPDWLRDNDFLHKGHRPPIPSVCTCFKSVFKVHTETGNIWTHLIGSIMVVMLSVYFLVREFTRSHYMWTDIAVMLTFFTCALLCLTFSWLFHTLHCHSNEYRLLFSKLDYVGIAVLIVGSFVPWLYYGFYCNDIPRLVYISSINILGIICIIISLWDRFAAPKFRPLRAGLYLFLGLSALVPAVHFIAMYGVERSFYEASFGWIILMAVLYITGACLYALRIPERFFPGKFDLWGHSHQIFHVFVVVAIFVHYYGVDQVAQYRVLNKKCDFAGSFYPNQKGTVE